MLKFIRDISRSGACYKVYRNGKILEHYLPNIENYTTNPNSHPSIHGNEEWCKFITKEAIAFINTWLTEEKRKLLTPREEKQLFDFYFNGDTLGIKEEIKKHKEEIKKLKEKLKNG